MENENIEEEVLNPNFLIVFLVLIILLLLFLFLKERARNRKVKLQDPDFKALRNRLSSREIEVLEALLNGKSQKEIAEILHIEISTIKSHLNKIYKLFNVKDKKQLIQLHREGNTSTHL
ncbi:MAG: helix-turn-helix transcriptional regulator [Cyclobacteriaceae bacterium]|nr:helix-turn-helix transcriptional regulator [Cyclobacteriaceae bacterium HetDA_MAG_MS6]